MAVTQLTCPECNATLRLKEAVPDGKRVRCRKCEAVFQPSQGRGDDNDLLPEPVRRRVSPRNDEMLSDRPRSGKKKRSKKKTTNPALILIPIALAVLVLGGGTAAAIYFLTGDKKTEPVAQAKGPTLNPIGAKASPAVNPNAGGGGNVGLAVSNMAMEIDSEDIDGKQFKLSDYRGKVVVLDFWGNW